jgi:hypothetical protein
MIETVLLDYLNNANLSAKVYMEQPKDKPEAFFILEKSGGGQTDHISESDFIVQSYGRTLYEAACMNEEIKAVMLRANTLNEVSAVELNSDYNYTNAESKSYRYQAVYVITHY